jgi:hypothetical protein
LIFDWPITILFFNMPLSPVLFLLFLLFCCSVLSFLPCLVWSLSYRPLALSCFPGKSCCLVIIIFSVLRCLVFCSFRTFAQKTEAPSAITSLVLLVFFLFSYLRLFLSLFLGPYFALSCVIFCCLVWPCNCCCLAIILVCLVCLVLFLTCHELSRPVFVLSFRSLYRSVFVYLAVYLKIRRDFFFNCVLCF